MNEELFTHTTTRNINETFISLEPYGHQLIMTFEHLYLPFFFALHGQMVVCDIPTFEQIKANTYIFKPTTKIAEISWQTAITFSHHTPQPIVFLFVDHNRIGSCHLSLRSENSSPYVPQERNCDPCLHWERYELNIRDGLHRLGKKIHDQLIFNLLLHNKLFFNGFGLNLATEALHRAKLHPMMSSHTIMNSPSYCNQLIAGLKEIATQDLTTWRSHIPKHFVLDDPFRYNQKAVTFYRENMNKVYQKNDASISIADCELLHQRGLLVISCFLTYLI